MKKNTLKTLVLSFVLGTTSLLNAQVTIGDSSAPQTGALLELKEAGTTTRGLGLPRVELKEIDELIMGTTVINDGDYDGNQYLKHTGLLVFNVSEESPFCPGLYVWDGAQWNSLLGNCSGLNISTSTPLNFPSGRDLRSLVGKDITVKWDPATGVISFNDNTNNAANNASFAKLKFTNANVFSPALTALTNATGSTLTITPDAMSDDDVSDNGGNPFKTKQSKFSLTRTDGSEKEKSNELVVTQTNKALLSDGKYTAPMIKEFDANAVATETVTYDITSNGEWRVKELIPATNNGIDANSIKIDNTVISLPSGNYGEEKEDGKGHDALTLSFNYTMGLGSTKVPYSKLILEDTQSPKRFSDLMYTVYQCTSLKDTSVKWPTMSEWAEIAGYPNVKEPEDRNADPDIAQTEDELAGIGKINPITGISWHRDQNGNIFLAASFHPTDMTQERWMITNLAATKYDSDVNYAATGMTQDLTGPTTVANDPYPYWAFPNGGSQPNVTAANTYNNNPRLGLLYNWAAATAGKGGNNGLQSNIDDGNVAPTTAKQLQGICPNGWHLPQDGELTDLENTIITNTNTFANKEYFTAPIGGTLTYPSSGWRGTLHGKAMLDACEQYNTPHQGQSNPISIAVRPGFEWKLAGYAYENMTYLYGTYAYLWTSSSMATWAWSRNIYDGFTKVYKIHEKRTSLLSIRCKQD